ncbi:hypothetical protein CC1G_14675 [Coprinopsis cinerea okayama7|uniref:MutL C-terminal dimerisation domain-containing protein n=1 Tax=Coprinopsis cinerea (strain Okayama-7 / 130 / ATCC MYA-4618 / FGSC 9003) TaxID=240176 RepID=D6RMZ0_COPC7|nr:hypothetical protein CC1G_14675 [Coprinopsis cinerea okayama7\|eukprot:XP_002911246.1 hypothetical protein CC1G_14675 [Coprinopsis cinerea okayama7\
MEAETLRGLSQPRVQEIKGTSKSTPSDFFVNVDEESRDVTWTDPDTGESFIIDSRTGISRLQPVQESENAESQLTGSVGAFRSERRTLKLQSQSSTQRPASTPEWLSRALKTNQAYQLSSSTEGPFAEPSFPVHRRRSDATQHVRSHDESAAMQISRDQLRQAQVINQVDRKFIACLVEVDFNGKKAGGMGASGSRASSTIMVLVDQHAADERIRVERFLRPLCIAFLRASAGRSEPSDGPVVTELPCPFPVLLTKHEASLLQRKETIQASFRNWGISFSEIPIESLTEASDSGTSKEYVQVFVTSLPSVLSDKGKELQECIKSFLGQLQEGEIRPYDAYFPGEATVGMEEWLSALRHCPRSLLELANSKACRGAIMFNDPLTREQCERLISQLAQAAYPFQCAHGRFVVDPYVPTVSK